MSNKKPDIIVLNPNASVQVTGSIEKAIQSSGVAEQAVYRYWNIPEAPKGIVTQHDADQAAVAVVKRLGEVPTDAVIIACFSDPGVSAVKERVSYPVIGIGMAGMKMALTQGERVGVIAVADAAIPRHWRYWRALGVERQVVGELALNLSVEQSGDPDLALERMCKVAKSLKQQGADVLLLGCAGMANLRQPLQEMTGLWVVEPCQAAAHLALWQLSLGRMVGN